MKSAIATNSLQSWLLNTLDVTCYKGTVTRFHPTHLTLHEDTSGLASTQITAEFSVPIPACLRVKMDEVVGFFAGGARKLF